MSREKKLRAAMTAVVAYLKEEEAGRLAAHAPQRVSDTPWAMHGRQTIMNNRTAWQRGTHRKSR